MKPPPVSITCTDLTLRFPVYGVDAKSLKKALARVAVGGRLGRHSGVTDVTALQSVSLKLEAGDRLGLIGHNGSGKTTLLRALSGAYEPDEGVIEVQGRIAALLDLGLGIDPSATGHENIRLRGRIVRRRQPRGAKRESGTNVARGKSEADGVWVWVGRRRPDATAASLPPNLAHLFASSLPRFRIFPAAF